MVRCGWLIVVATFLTAGYARAELSRVQIAQKNAPAVVAVNVMKPNGESLTGTGFVLTPDGLIATNRHVTEGAMYMNITFPNGTISTEAQLIAQSKQVDLALLKIRARNLPVVRVGSSRAVRTGQDITVIGNPRRLQNTVSSGIISQIRQQSNGVLWHQISAPISPSSSGSPVFDTQGRVISIVFANFPGNNNQNLNFSIPSDYLLRLVHRAGFRLPGDKHEALVSQTVSAAAGKQPQETSVPSFLQACWNHCQKSWELLRRIIHNLGLKTYFPSRS